MATEIYLVKVGMTMHEGTVEEWYVGDGERVDSGALLYRLETEKVNLDVDAETDGIVKHLVAEGTTLEPGNVVGYIYADGEAIPDMLPTPTPKPASVVREEPAHAEPAPAKPAEARPRIAASPVARKLAAELGVDLAAVAGTGPRGRITKEDIQLAADAAPSTMTADAAGAQPLRGMRKTIAERMVTSLRDTAQLTITMEVGMDEAIRLRQDLIAEWEAEGVRVTYTDLVLAAATKALVRHPAMNAALMDDAITRFDAVHIGIAVALDEGLIVPVVKNAEAKSLKQIAIESAALAQARPHRPVGAGRRGRRHLHRHVARHVRRGWLHAHPQSAASWHSRCWAALRRRGLGWRPAHQGRPLAALAHVGSPRAGWRSRR